MNKLVNRKNKLYGNHIIRHSILYVNRRHLQPILEMACKQKDLLMQNLIVKDKNLRKNPNAQSYFRVARKSSNLFK